MTERRRLLRSPSSRHPENAALSTLATEVLDRTKPGLFELKVLCAEPCELVADSKIVHGARATERTVYLLPGSHAVVADFGEGRTTSQSFEAVETNAGEVTFELPVQPVEAETTPASVDPDPDPPPTHDQGTQEKASGWSPTVFWVGAGLTAVAGGITIWSGVDTDQQSGRRARAERVQRRRLSALQGRRRQTEPHQRLDRRDRCPRSRDDPRRRARHGLERSLPRTRRIWFRSGQTKRSRASSSSPG